jgi:amino acid transporter
MKAIKNILDFIGFTSFSMVVASTCVFVYGVAYELPKKDPLYEVFLKLSVIGAVIGFIWGFCFLVWLYFDDKKNKLL